MSVYKFDIEVYGREIIPSDEVVTGADPEAVVAVRNDFNTIILRVIDPAGAPGLRSLTGDVKYRVRRPVYVDNLQGAVTAPVATVLNGTSGPRTFL